MLSKGPLVRVWRKKNCGARKPAKAPRKTIYERKQNLCACKQNVSDGVSMSLLWCQDVRHLEHGSLENDCALSKTHPKNRSTRRCNSISYGQHSGYLLGAQTVRMCMLQCVLKFATCQHNLGYATLVWQGSPVDVNKPDLRWERMDAQGWMDNTLNFIEFPHKLMKFSCGMCHVWGQDVRSWRKL